MHTTFDSQVFQFEDTFTLRHEGPEILAVPSHTDASEKVLEQALSAAGEAAYRWEISTDTITWSANAAEVLGCKPQTIATGRLFGNLLDAENLTSRYETVMYSKAQDSGQGVPFQIEYLFRNQGRKGANSIWLEDNGRWRAGADGSAQIVHGTVRRVDARHNRDQHLSYLGNSDQLTGMMNRSRLTEALGETLNNTKITGAKCCLAIASVNNLNLVNDAYGFAAANDVIIVASQRLRQVMRQDDNIARYSGRKFGIILNDCDEQSLLQALARFNAVIRDSVIETSRGPVWASISLGAVVLPDHGDNAIAAISHAEEALSDAMRTGSDGMVIYQPSKSREAVQEFNIHCASQLLRCVRAKSFHLAYQPIVDAKTHLPVMHEALLRMSDDTSPQDFCAAQIIPLAERLGLVRMIDQSALKLTMQALNCNADLHLTMNVSGATAVDAYWNEQFLEILMADAAAAARLTVEIHEAVAFDNLKTTRRFMERLREAGTSVAVDRFGQTYGAVSALRELPINVLKLDGSLIRNINDNADSEYLLKSLLDMAAKFNLKSVVTWIESKPVADTLTRLGADFLQGNHFGEASVKTAWGQPAEAAIVAETADQKIAAVDHQLPLPVEAKPSEIQAPFANEASVLDFSEIDESIGRLRDALSGLSAATQKSDPAEHATHAA